MPVACMSLSVLVRMFDVLLQPAIIAAFAPNVAAQGPCALLEPNSLTGLLVALHTREAFVATAIW